MSPAPLQWNPLRRLRTFPLLLAVPLLAPVAELAPRLGAQETVLVAVGEEWRYLKGTAEPSLDPASQLPTTAWTEIGYDDSAWLTGETGIGYADNDDQTVLADMRNSYWSFYARKSFRVESVGGIQVLELTVDYDDGFVAYLNGFEVARSGLTGFPPPFNEASAEHEAGTPESFPLDPSFLEEGENVLAFQVHNTSLSSSDCSLIPELIANPDLCPPSSSLTCTFNFTALTVTLRWTNETDYDIIEVRRNGEVLDNGLTGDTQTYTDFTPIMGQQSTYEVVATLQGEPCAPIECSVFATLPEDLIIREGDRWSYFRGSQAPPADWFQTGFDDAGWTLGRTGIGYGDGDDATILGDMQQVAGVEPGYMSVFCRRKFQLESVDDGQLFLSILYDDGVVVYVNGTEIGRSNMPQGAIAHTTAASGAAPEPSFFEAPLRRNLLIEGENLLAASVHNSSLTSSDLSFIPVLLRLRGGAGDFFIRGDVSNEGRINITDAIALLEHLFRGEPPPACPDSADVDDSGSLNITDAIVLLEHLFRSQPEPPAPGLQCGSDPSDDQLGNCPSAACGL